MLETIVRADSIKIIKETKRSSNMKTINRLMGKPSGW